MDSLWSRFDSWLCQRWLPCGLLVLLSGFFWAPTSHNYKVFVNALLLLPCLLSLLSPALWRDRIFKTPLLLHAFIYLAYLTLLTLYLTGNAEFMRWAALILLFLVGVGLRMRTSQRVLVRIMLFSALTASLAGIYAVVRDIQAGIFLTYHYRMEGYGALYNALRSGMLFGALALMSLWGAYSGELSRWQRYAAIAIALVCLGALVLTGSRAPLLALLILGVAITVTYKRWWLLAIIVIGTVTVSAIAWDALLDRGTSFRFVIWPQVWAQYLKAPIFGVGLQLSPIASVVDNITVYNEHSLLLAMLRQGGILAPLLYLNFALRVCVQGWRSRNQCLIGFLAGILQIYSLVSLQVEAPRLVTRPADIWIMLWLPAALLMYSQWRVRDAAVAPRPAV